MDGTPRATTTDILERLARLGLYVSAEQLENDTRDGFLPPRGGSRGRPGLWEPWIARRAELLYRLRWKRDRDGAPAVHGDVLRIILFIQDGWGWEGRLKTAALAGFDKTVAAARTPVEKHTRRARTVDTLSTALETADVVCSPEEKYSIGLLEVGEPLSGGSLQGVYQRAENAGLLDGFAPIAREFGFDKSAFFGEALFTFILGGLTHKVVGVGLAPFFRKAIERISAKAAKESLPGFRRFVLDLRRYFHRAAIAKRQRVAPTNPLTLFGRRQRDLDRDFRHIPGLRRITPAQSLALLLALSFSADQLLQAFASQTRLFTMIVRMFGARKSAPP